MKTPAKFAIFMLLATCTATVQRPPSNINNACVIKQERPNWYNALKATEAKWQVPVPVMLAIIYQESKFKGQARTPLNFQMGVIPIGRDSSAYGYSQALDSTWDEYQRKTGRRGAKRDNFADSLDFMGWYMDQSNQRLGIPKSSARKQYLAYHDGIGGYRRGTYKRKPWLMRIAKDVQARAKNYTTQLQSCNS